MHTIDLHIVELLKKNDCVIVPGFGGFLLKVKPAFITDSMHEILPPSKGISFNRSLIVNDGLLANYVALKENTTYNEAQERILKFSEDCKNKLLNSGSLALSGIGNFSLGAEGTWTFTPALVENFLFSSFGLSAIQLSPVEVKVTKNNREKQTNVSLTLPASRKNNKWIKSGTIAASLLLAIMISVLFYTNHTSENGSAFASWYNKIKDIKGNEATKIESVPAIEAPETEDLYSTASATEYDTQHYQSAGFSFYVIGGSFTKVDNARTFAKKLEEKGFKAEVLDNENGFFRVAYHKENDSISADHFLQGIKKENQSAWILKW